MAIHADDRVLIRGATLLTPGAGATPTDVMIADGLVRPVGDGDVTGVAEVRRAGLIIAPGFIDVHVHGAGGDVFEAGDVEANARISARLARYGTVGILATMAALPAEALRRAVAAIAAVQGHEPGARILGIHLEGPYLNPRRCGAQKGAWMRAPSIEEFDGLQRLAGGAIRLLTVAPELEGALSFIRGVRARGVTVALGHTEASAAEVEAALTAGVTHVTHLCNAMAPLHHRAPGPIGVALTEDVLSVEVICDGHHLDPRIVDLVFRCKPRDRIVLVSDGVAAGMPDGQHELFGVSCVVRDGTIRTTADGQLAGSCLTLDIAVRNVKHWQPGLALEEILACASAVPARAVGLVEQSAAAARGPTDLAILTADMRVAATVVSGRFVWRDPALFHA
jgi:N-acetylglucosamine-6-phosphate deacetylase